jgi:hypothetical protein
MPAREHAHEPQAGNNGSHEAPSAAERETRGPAPAREYHAEPRESAAPQAAPLAHFEPSPRSGRCANSYVVWSSAPTEKPPGGHGPEEP